MSTFPRGHRGTKAGSSHLVGDVMSAWNCFQETGPTVIERAAGCRVWDADGVERIDWIMGWGSLVLGHDPTEILAAIRDSLESGFGYQYESPLNEKLAGLVVEMVPSAERVRLANSGTEATLHAIRVARAVTGRRIVIKFEGHFHGLNDYLLFGVDGSPVDGDLRADRTIEPIVGSAGIPEELASLVAIVAFNDIDAVEAAFDLHADDVACVIVEPVSLNTGCVMPDVDFLQSLRILCSDRGALLVFDEVLTGFRMAAGGAQEYFDVLPDLTTLGKALGCGAPAAALCGPAEYMDVLTPVGAVDMAGTNTGRHLTVAAIVAALTVMKRDSTWKRLWEANDRFVAGTRELFEHRGVPAYVEGAAGRIGVHIGSVDRPTDFRSVVGEWNRPYHIALYRELHEHKDLFGFLLPLGRCPEAVTLSAVHSNDDIDETLQRLDDAVVSLGPYQSV